MEEIQYSYPGPFPEAFKKVDNAFNGNFTYRGDFDKQPSNVRYIFLRTITDKWHVQSNR